MGAKPQKRNIYLLVFLVIFVFLSFFIFLPKVFAATSYSIEDIGGEVGLGTVDLKTLVINIIKWVLGVLSLVAVSYLIYGGVLWLTSRGNEEKIAKAKKTIINAVIGVIIVLLAWAIVLLVARYITNAGSGGSGTACTTGETSSDGCRECVAGIWNYILPEPVGCTLPGSVFYTKKVGTAHGGSDESQDVYLCSRIQPLFNNNVDSVTVADSAAAALNPLTIVKQSDSTKKEGVWETSDKAITFKHPKVCTVGGTACSDQAAIDACTTAGGNCELALFEANTNYEARLPNTIMDLSATPLPLRFSPLSPLYCHDSGNGYVACNFETGSTNDTENPTITDTYPIHEGSGYPDRNVPRMPVIDVNFSETIDATTVVDSANSPHPLAANVKIDQLDNTRNLIGTVDNNILQIELKESGFRLSLTDDNAFESFTWYRITVQNVEDLCGNTMPDPVVWDFQTNDVVAGFKSWNPTGSNECPEVKITVVFNTTMFFNRVSFSVNGQQIIFPRPSDLGPTPVYRVTIADSDPGTFDGTLEIPSYDIVPGDTATLIPDNHFRVFELTPAAPLTPGTTYNISVTTDRVIDSVGGTLNKDWSFSVTTPELCACKPYVASLNPSQGGRGECLTVYGSCFKGTTNHPANPSHVRFDATDAPINASESNYIITTSPSTFSNPDRPEVTVQIDYTDPTYGSVTSDPLVSYYYATDDQADGPCLFSLTTAGNSCYPGTPAVLRGIRFGPATQLTKNVTFGNRTFNASANPWSDTRIDSAVPATSEEYLYDGDVNVQNTNGWSNGIPFDICQPPPGVPIVTQFWPTCDSACVNAVAGAKFSEEMDSVTLTSANIKLDLCANLDCDLLELPAPDYSVSYDGVGKILTIIPSANLAIDRWYKVTLTDAVRSLEDVSIGNPNEGNNFVWKFKTKNDANLCSLASVDVIPATRTLKVNQSLNYTAYAYGSPDSCDVLGQMLNSQSYNWSWQSSNPLQASVSSNDTNIANGLTDPQQSVSALAVTNSVHIQATAQGYSDYGDLTITEDPTYCVTNADCLVNELGEDCPGSTCLNNRCTPVLNSFSPSDGAVGTWVAAKGCWFGTYVSGSSKLLFFNNQEGTIPDTNICGTSTWTNTRILREVPGAAATGVITVNRNDGQTAVSSLDFTVNAVVRPGICALNPNVGREGLTEVQIRGKNFGATRGTSQVTFYNNRNADYSPAIWEDNNIRVIVPTNAETGDVTATVNSIVSNGWPFQVLPSTCTTLCSQDSDCFVVPNQGCDSDGCCSDRPTYTSSPANNATDVCLNTAIRVVFNQSMDQSTLNASNILLARLSSVGPPPVWTNIPLAGKITTDSKTAIISLGALLERNSQYRISLHPTNIKNSKGVSLGTLGTIVFTTADSSGPCQLNSLSLTPASHIFTENTQTQSFTALALDNKANPIDRIPGVYDWTWTWSSIDSSVVGITNSDNNVQIATPLKNGNTTIKVTATGTAGWTGTKTAQASARVIFCDMPWMFQEAANNCQITAEGCGINFNFSLFYCRGKLNGTLLPDFDVRTIRGQSGSVLKQFLFKELDPEKKDAIGLRIYANPEGLSPMDWYKKNIENPGSPQSMTVDGYQAVRDGRTVYVGATNINYTSAQIYNNIYLISYNDEASSETKNIFDQMLSNWLFNTNISNDADKPLITRDLKRINDLKAMVGYLENYRVSHQEYKSENIALDSGFEINSSIPSANWYTQGTPLEVSIATDQKYEGSRAVKISLGSNGSEWAIQDMAVELGKTYEVSAWIKTNITGTGAGSLLSQCRTPGNLDFNWTTCKLNKTTTAVTGVTDWVKRSVVVNANLADHILRIGCGFGTGASGSGQIWCDNFQVREITSPYPALTAGSYLSNMSTSRWPSWQANLGNDLGKTLPVDPTHNIICQGTPSDANACWDEPTKTFTCLAGSHIYAYKTDNGLDYQLYANLEYSGLGNWLTGSYLTCTPPSSCQCFNKLISGP